MQPTPAAAALRAQNAWKQGQALGRQGRWRDAARRFETATRLQPDDALYGINLANALLKDGKPERAGVAAAAARRADPDSALALTLQATALLQAGSHEALVELLQGVASERLDAPLQAMLADAQMKTGRAPAAMQSYLAALARDPANAELHLNLGCCLNSLGHKREGAECFRTALLLGVGSRRTAVANLLTYLERQLCDWRGDAAQDTQVRALRESLAALPDDAAVETNPFAHVALLDDPAEQLRAARIDARHTAARARPLPPRRAVAVDRLRIGYASADFHAHATSHLMAELFERHDRRRVEVFLYSWGPDDGSAVRRRVMDAADRFVEARSLGTRELADRIRADGIDILVDLKGRTDLARPELFAHRPAPLQVAYLGFPGTSGAECIDYVVGDPQVTPIDHAHWFSEKIAQLPLCYQCNDGSRPLPVAPARASQGLPEDALVLCGFNQPYKISPAVFDVWCRLLQRLPQAVLWLLHTPHAADALRGEAAARGVDPARLVFAPPVDQRAHLDRAACADLFLDTWPYNGHTTASDLLWAGVPVVTLGGRSFASRVAGSLLTAAGVPDGICTSVDEYESLALALATDTARRQALAAQVRAARTTSPLFSSARLAPQLEALYERMWARAVAGLPPEHLPAE